MLSRLILPFVSLGFISCGTEIIPAVADIYTAVYIGSDGDSEVFRGYIGGMFNITVDGISYEDSESWYNAEMEKIPARLEAAGYNGDDFDFQAQVGLNDFWQATKVNVASTKATGYQGSSTVTPSDGSFEIRLPGNSFGNYQIKSVKRLTLVLPNDERFCYNMKGIEKSYMLNAFTDPIIISSFTTSLTKYECSSPSSPSFLGLTSDSTSSSEKMIVDGISRAEVKEAIGSPWKFAISSSSSSSSQTWYYPEYYDGTIPANAISKSTTYSCKLVFKKIESDSEEAEDDENLALYSADKCSEDIIEYIN